MATLQTWVIAMSSSQIRSFRHTATVVALEVETALCDVAAACEKEAEVVGRQREGEKKRKASNKGGGARLKELEQKAHEIRERRTKLAEFLKEFVDGFVFILCATFIRMTRNRFPVSSSTAIATSTRIFVQSAFAPSASGSGDIPAISSMHRTYDMSAGSSQTLPPLYVWRPSRPSRAYTNKPIMSAPSTILLNGSSHV